MKMIIVQMMVPKHNRKKKFSPKLLLMLLAEVKNQKLKMKMISKSKES
jgi:hypothetical protein